MHISVYLALGFAMVLSLALRPVAGRLAPQPAAIIMAAGSLIGGAVWVTALALLGTATVARMQAIGELGQWSATSVGAHDPVPVAAGAVSLLALIATCVVLAAATRRLAHGLMEVRRLHSATSPRRCGDLAIIDAAAPQALALPGWRGSVVVTSGMLRALDPVDRQVMLAHERSHLSNAHWVFRVATRLGAALLPLSRPLVSRCDQSLERWADEQAAELVGDRRVTATAVAKAALAATDHHRCSLVPAFSDGAVTDRVEALLRPRARSRWGLSTLLAGLAIMALATLMHAGHDLDAFLDLSRYLGRS